MLIVEGASENLSEKGKNRELEKLKVSEEEQTVADLPKSKGNDAVVKILMSLLSEVVAAASIAKGNSSLSENEVDYSSLSKVKRSETCERT